MERWPLEASSQESAAFSRRICVLDDATFAAAHSREMQPFEKARFTSL